MQASKDSTDVTTYFVLRDSTTHAPKTDVTITDIDLYYVAHKAAISAKADATTLDAADSAHADNKAFNVGQGVYRIDWPDIWAGAVGTTVQLIVVCSGVDTTFLEIEITDVPQTGDSYAKVNDATIGLANLKALIDAIQADIGDASSGTLGSLYAILGNAAATLTSRIPSGTPGANNGAVTTNGTKVNQTVDLTAGQSIACLDKTGFTLAAGGVPVGAFAANAITDAALATDVETAIATAIKNTIVEDQGNYTIQQVLSIVLSVLAGITTNNGLTLKTPNGVVSRVAATVDVNNNRTAMTLTPSA